MSKSDSPVFERDWPHFQRLSEDLWRETGSQVSLMVGAGLSKNARPLPGASRHFPTGEELADVMRSQLPSHGGFRSDNARKSDGAAFSPARVASEYEAEFNRRGLEDLIRKQVPDDDYEPGLLHEELLQLPWRDVFTTNYDTLLERTNIPDRTYNLVVSEKDLPRVASPRIVKLHGSLSGGSRLISTEEDYRTFPDDFPLFVHTVRQALIEKPLVLVGFSGEDLNFLSWTGWVRDKLKKSHPPIYLIVPPGRKTPPIRLLSQRGVTPICLTDVSGVRALGQSRTGAAILEFVRSLLRRKPHEEKWSIEISGDTVDGPSWSTESGDRSEKVQETLQRWRLERESYPGWLIAPESQRRLLWQTTRRWIEPILEASTDRSVADAVVALAELNWRLEVAMVPLFDTWWEMIDVATTRMTEAVEIGLDDPSDSKVRKSASSGGWSTGEAWVRLVLALARRAREDDDETHWDRYMKELSGPIERYPGLVDRYHYERALWKLTRIDREGAQPILEKWEPARNSLRARIWKAGLLAETGRLERARESLRELLSAIRKAAQGTERRSVEMWSLEGWCSYLLYATEASLDLKNYETIREEFTDRWRELQEVDCDPWTVNDYFADVLGREIPEIPRNVRTRRAFDPGRRHVVRSVGGDGISPWLPAFACLRWFEEVGIPVRGRKLARLGREELVAACRWVTPFHSHRGVLLLVRAGAASELREGDFMDRPRVAEMDVKVAMRLNEIMLAAARREADILSEEPQPWSDAGVLEAAVEVLSRVTVRLPPGDLESAFQSALTLYERRQSLPVHGVGKATASWFARLYDAADDEVLAGWLPNVLDASVRDGGKDGEFPIWQDPLVGYRLGRVLEVEGDPRKQIQGAVARLIARGQAEPDSHRREDVVWRLSALSRLGLMTEGQKREFATLVWRKAKRGGLPKWKGLWVGDYAELRARRGNVVRRIKDDLLGRRSVDRRQSGDAAKIFVLERGEERFWEIGAATTGVVEMPYEPRGFLEWTEEEREFIWKGVLAWWEERQWEMKVEEAHIPFSGERDRVRSQAADLERCLIRVKVSGLRSDDGSAWKEVTTFMEETRELGVELAGASPYLLISRPRRRKQTVERLVEDLRYAQARRAEAASRAVRHWVYLGAAGCVTTIPRVVIDALANRVAFRKLPGASECVRNLVAILRKKGTAIPVATIRTLVASLDAWEEAVQQNGEDGDRGGFPQKERPDLREAVGTLAYALNTWWTRAYERSKPPTAIARILKEYAEDPLPEVRRSVSK